MIMKSSRVRTFVIVGLVLLVASVAASKQKWSKPYVGAKVCAYCHKVQYEKWKNSVHAKAFEVLPANQRKNKYCLSCHSMGANPELRAVQCEACHGEGSQYARKFVMKDKKLSKALGLVASPGQETCAKCHTGTCTKLKEFKFEDAIEKIRQQCATSGKTPKEDSK